MKDTTENDKSPNVVSSYAFSNVKFLGVSTLHAKESEAEFSENLATLYNNREFAAVVDINLFKDFQKSLSIFSTNDGKLLQDLKLNRINLVSQDNDPKFHSSVAIMYMVSSASRGSDSDTNLKDEFKCFCFEFQTNYLAYRFKMCIRDLLKRMEGSFLISNDSQLSSPTAE